MIDVVDKSWGVPGTSVPVGSNDIGSQVPERAVGRAEAMAQRQDARAARRDADAQARDQGRDRRRAQGQPLAGGDPHAAAAGRRRSSGRRDVVREQRDTSGYATIVDAARLRELASRGASLAGLSAVFGLPASEVERLLAERD